MKITIEHAGTKIKIEDPDKTPYEVSSIKDMIVFATNQIKGLQNQAKSFSETKVSLEELESGNSTNHEWNGAEIQKIGYIK